jgi:protein-tyrosine phosphatase
VNRHITFESLANFRDLGGCRTTDGHRTRPGLLYRTDSLGKLRPGTPDWDRYLSLGIRTVIDLRYPWEVADHGRIPAHDSFTYHNLSIEHRPYNQAALGPDVAVGPYLAKRYMEVAEDGTKEIAQTLTLIADAVNSSTPLAFHCASGKDRTGLIAALVLTLVDVPHDTISEDFALTELAAPALLADWRARNNGHSPNWPAFGRAPTEVMDLFLKSLTSRYGSIDAYVTNALALDADLLRKTLRKGLLEPAP